MLLICKNTLLFHAKFNFQVKTLHAMRRAVGVLGCRAGKGRGSTATEQCGSAKTVQLLPHPPRRRTAVSSIASDTALLHHIPRNKRWFTSSSTNFTTAPSSAAGPTQRVPPLTHGGWIGSAVDDEQRSVCSDERTHRFFFTILLIITTRC